MSFVLFPDTGDDCRCLSYTSDVGRTRIRARIRARTGRGIKLNVPDR